MGALGLAGLLAIAVLARFQTWPRQKTFIALAVWWLGVLALLATAAANPADMIRFWLLLGAFGLLGGLYAGWVRRMKTRAQPDPAMPKTDLRFSPSELDRYARHILLREIGGPGQARLKAARVLVVGAGGLGSPVLLYLAATGVGTIGVIDPDQVEITNLQRQIIHTDEAIGMPKVFSAQTAIKALNPFVTVRPYNRKLDDTNAAALIADYDLVLDGSDDFATRTLVNRACVAAGVPLISGALTPWEGQVALFDPAQCGPCYACIFPVEPAPDLVPSCAVAGVAAPLPGVIGSLMAIEAIKHLTGAGTTLSGRLMIYDALHAETRVIKTPRRADCPVCAGGSSVL